MPNGNTYFLLTISAFFWGANFLLGQIALQDLTPIWAATARFTLGAALMFAIVAVKRERLFDPLRRHAATYLMLGVLGIVAFNLFFFEALRHTSANNAALIMATNPLLTTLLAAAFLGERPGTRHFIALPIALAGVAVVVTQGRLGNLFALALNRGDLLMLAANVFWALFNVACRRYMPQGPSALVNTTWITTAGALVLLGAALASGEPAGVPGINAAISIAIMAAGGTVLAYLFWNLGIARLGAARTAIFLNLVPVFAMLLGTAVAASPTHAQLAGGLLVLGGVSLPMLRPRRGATA